MQLLIFDGNCQLAGIIEAYEYFRWVRRYSRCGSFELKAVATDTNLALLQIGNILWKNDDEESAYIEIRELSQNEQEFVTVSGRFATGLLSRRIVWGTEILSGDLGAAVGTLLHKHIINPTDAARKIPGVAYLQTAFGIAVNTQISFRNLLTTVCELCETADIGIKTAFNPTNGMHTIILYRGADSQAVFSREYDNILEQVFVESVAEHAGIALIGGEGEGSGRTFVTVGGGAGIERREIFVDAKDLRSEDFSDYPAALTFRGNSALASAAAVRAFDATVNQYANLRYKTDFDLGDNVVITSKKWGITMNARITEVSETYDANGMSIDITFGKPLLTLAERIKGGI